MPVSGDDDEADLLLDQRVTSRAALLLPRLLALLRFCLELAFLVAQLGGALEVLVADRLVLLLAQLARARSLRSARSGGGTCAGQTHACARLVDDVDRLVRQEAVGDVAIRQLDGRLERLVGDP